MKNYDLVQLLKDFQQWNPELIKRMKITNQNFSDFILNDHHLEGDVFTHTIMCYNELLRIVGRWGDEVDLMLGISVLCHDIGKVYVEQEKGIKKIYHSHQFASIQDTVDFINYLNSLPDYNITNIQVKYIMSAISNHIDFPRSELKKQWFLSDFDETQLFINWVLSICDNNGRICYDDKVYTNKTMDHLVSVFPNRFSLPMRQKEKDCDCEIVFLCGIPSVGKDYYIENYGDGSPVVSYDSIRIKLYKEYNSIESLTEKELYKNAFEYCNENKINLNHYLEKEVKQYVSEGYIKIYISNTNTTRKSRRSLINLLGVNKYRFSAVYLLRDLDDVIKSDKMRESKTVGRDVINRFAFNQQIPSCQEGFDRIEVLLC